MYLLTNERYITYQTGFSFGRMGQVQGWDVGVPWGVGGSKLFFPKFNQIWCVSYLHELHEWGLGEGSKIYFSEHGHLAYQIKGDEQ